MKIMLRIPPIWYLKESLCVRFFKLDKYLFFVELFVLLIQF